MPLQHLSNSLHQTVQYWFAKEHLLDNASGYIIQGVVRGDEANEVCLTDLYVYDSYLYLLRVWAGGAEHDEHVVQRLEVQVVTQQPPHAAHLHSVDSVGISSTV